MMNTKFIATTSLSRRSALAGIALGAMLLAAPAMGQEVTGQLRILNWQQGAEDTMWNELEAAFTAEHPGVEVSELEITAQGDARGGIRSALLGGEVVDLVINTWPAFRAELASAGIIRPLDKSWATEGWDQRLSQSWKDLGSTDGVSYGLPYTYGDRSAIWYRDDQLEEAGLSAPPATWEEFLGSFDALKASGIETPVAMPGKYWAHAEWFETLLVRTSGVETAAKLAAHEIPWTDPAVKAALVKYAEMLNAGCCGPEAVMFANDWDGETDQIFQAGTKSYILMGMWVSGRLTGDFGLAEGTDYSIFQFPALGMGHDNTAIVDSKELLATANGANPQAADAFLDFMTTKEAADILAKYGFASPSAEADVSLLGPVQQIATKAVAESEVHFVLGDLLPGDLADEYRVQLQRFLQDPSDANIDAVLQAIEAKSLSVY